MKILTFTCLIVLSAMLFGARAEDRSDCLELAALLDMPNTLSFNRVVSGHLLQAFDEADICATVIHVPPARAAIMLRNGEVDGEIARLAGYENERNGTAIRVPEPLGRGIGYLLHPKGENLSARDKTTFRLGYLNGYAWHAFVAESYPLAISTRDYDTLLRMLQNDRIDGLLIDNFTWDHLPDRDKYEVKYINQADFFLYLRKDLEDFIPAVNAAIKAYKDSGRSFTAY